MLEKFDILSINPTTTQIKLQEAWKAKRDENFKINFKRMRRTEYEKAAIRAMRATTKKEMR